MLTDLLNFSQLDSAKN